MSFYLSFFIINYLEIKFDNIHVNEDGYFKYTIKKIESKLDKDFHLYFKQKGLERKVLTINIIDNKIVNLDTIFMKPIDIVKSNK